jgi:hypothetical protein
MLEKLQDHEVLIEPSGCEMNEKWILCVVEAKVEVVSINFTLTVTVRSS